MLVDSQLACGISANKDRDAGRFAGETPAQIAKHNEIKRRHRRRRKDGALLPRLRIAELDRIFAMQYGSRNLPDDDAGRADLRLMADHLAQIDPRRIRSWATLWMPTLPADELDALIADVGTGKWWKADALAHELGLDDATRTRLKIKTVGAVDCTKRQRKSRRRRKRIAADRARRAKAGARPRAQSAERLMPWKKAGISRAKYYRLRRAAQRGDCETFETDSRPIDCRSPNRINRCHGAPVGAADPGREHGAKSSPVIAKPLTSSFFRVPQHCDLAKTDEVAGLEDISFRDAHREHYDLLTILQPSARELARLVELNEIIEAEGDRRRRSRMASRCRCADENLELGVI